MSDETPDTTSDVDGTADLGGPLPPLDSELAAWLATVPAPPMPPEVWERIEGALAAEPPFTAPMAPVVATADVGGTPAAVGGTRAAVGRPVADLSEHRRRRSRVLPVLAGAAGVVLVGAVVVPAMRAGNTPAPTADVGGAVAEQGGGAPASVVAEPDPSPDMVGTPPTAAMPRMMMSSGTDYASTAMPDQVAPLLQTAGLTDAAAVATMSSTLPTELAPVGTGGFTSSPESLANCMDRLGMTASGPPTLVVDRATYDGADVGVVVTVNMLPAGAQEPAVLDVIVVGSECSDADVAAAQRFEYVVTP